MRTFILTTAANHVFGKGQTGNPVIGTDDLRIGRVQRLRLYNRCALGTSARRMATVRCAKPMSAGTVRSLEPTGSSLAGSAGRWHSLRPNVSHASANMG